MASIAASGTLWARSTLTLGLASWVVGCSPSLFLVREREAHAALANAEAAHAQDLATYELTQSRLFLNKARELASRAHYGRALALAERSAGSAQRARTLAIARAGVSAE